MFKYVFIYLFQQRYPLMTEVISYRKNELVEQFTLKIASAWHKATESIIETGKYLLDAEQQLSKAEFRDLRRTLEDKRIMSGSVISKILGIARNQVLTNPEYQNFLPPSYATLYLLSQQDENILQDKIVNNEISAEIEQKDVKIIFNTSGESTVGSTKQKTTSLTNTIALKGDFSKVSKEVHEELINILKKLKTFDIDIQGIELS